ncbi:hypothetical protein [Tychonema sp. LEGE 07203]|uniref:hypothetical protein n=1 Tax=Tychonema sp. LEGE 07203 TaxID=1828671 RepID=UPI001880FE84|nr:hypothetical protein [Tychonema sp. LEGE 07203]MBE9096661.1 hypothetical protein [Tychonema sp. LEGE 07203]
MIYCFTILITLFILLKLVKIKHLAIALSLETGFLRLSPARRIQGENPVYRPGVQPKSGLQSGIFVALSPVFARPSVIAAKLELKKAM